MKLRSGLLAVTASIACLSACTLAATSQDTTIAAIPDAAETQHLFENQNVLILLESVQEANELTINVSRRGYQLIERRRLDGLGLILLDFQRPPGVSDEVALNDMRQMSPSATVGLDTLYRAQAPYEMPDNTSSLRYANSLLGWPLEGCQAQTAIGIIDGYLDDAVSGMPANRIVSRNFMRGDAAASQHAEAVAKLLMGPGRLNDVQIFSAGVIGTSRSGSTGSGAKELVLALDWMRSEQVSVVNVSLAGPDNPILARAIQTVTDNGMIVVAAVGNEGPEAPPQYPAAFGSVIGVTAIDVEREVFRKAVRGTHVEYAAPGVDIFIDAGPEDGRFVSGTSFAAPFITALIAADPAHAFSGNISSVRAFLDDRTLDLGDTGPDPVFGKGLVQVDNACAT